MRRSNLIFLLVAITWILNGCGTKVQQAVTIMKPPYEKLTYRTVEVQRGNLSASVTLELEPEGYEKIVYYAAKEALKLDKVYISAGDKVKKGDILVSFESERIQKMITDYEDEKEQKELLVQHYENLMQIDKNMDYEADIRMLHEDIQVAELYIEEAKGILADYQVVAKADGIITEVSEYLQSSIIKPEAELLTQVCGTGKYLTETVDTSLFSVGEIYPVSAGGIEYELRLTDITGDTLTFQSVSGVSLVSGDETLTLRLEKPEQKNVVYVNRHAVCTAKGNEEGGENYYVYIMLESGYQRAVFVTPGDRIGENIIITEGLSGGEKVVIR